MLCIIAGCSVPKSESLDTGSVKPPVEQPREEPAGPDPAFNKHYQFKNGMIIVTEEDEDITCGKND